MNRKDSPLERLGAVLDKSLKRLDLAGRLDQYGVWPVWNDTVGTTVARNAQPEKIRNGTLFVKVSSPVWMQQLQYMKELLAEKLNQQLGSELIKNIFFLVGRVDTEIMEATPKQSSAAPRPAVEPKLENEFLRSVEDPEIRQAFEKLVASYTRRKQKP